MILKTTEALQREKGAELTFNQIAVNEFERMRKIWQMCDDCFSGESSVKENAIANRYIAIPSSKQGNSPESKLARDAYIRRGKMPSFAGDTLEQSCGILGTAEPEIRLEGKAEVLNGLVDYATPFHDGLRGLFRRVIENVLRYGRYCLLLEPNDNASGESLFHINEYKPHKFLRAIPYENGGESYARAIFLDTSNIEYDTELWKEVFLPQITVLALDASGRYYQAKFGISRLAFSRNADGEMVFSEKETASNAINDVMGKLEKFNLLYPDETACDELVYPDKYGVTFERIPFTCINSSDLNFMHFGSVPLQRLCEQCLHILNADCDHQHAIFMTTDPIPTVIGGETGETQPFQMSPDKVVYLPEGYSFGFVSPSGGGLDAQKRNIEEMMETARRMGVSLAGTESAAYTPGVSLELLRNAQTAALKIINATCGSGVEEQLRFAGMWLGLSDDELKESIAFVPSNAFAEIKATAAEAVSVAVNAANMMMTEEEVRKYMEKNGFVPVRDWEEVKSELDAQKLERAEGDLNSVRNAFGFGNEPPPTDEGEEGKKGGE